MLRPVSIITIRSTPIPSPPDGGIAYSRAARNSSSSSIASTVEVQEPADPLLVVRPEVPAVGPRAEQDVGGGQDRHRAEQAAHERDRSRPGALHARDVGGPQAAEDVGERPADPVAHRRQAAREEAEECEPDDDTDGHQAQVEAERPPPGARVGPRRELATGEQEQGEGQDTEDGAGPARGVEGNLHGLLRLRGHDDGDPHQQPAQDDVDGEDPPRDAHPPAHGRGEDAEEGGGGQVRRGADGHHLDGATKPVERLAQERQDRRQRAERRHEGEVRGDEAGQAAGQPR